MTAARMILMTALSTLLLAGCGSAPKKQAELTPQQKAQIEQQRVDRQQELKAKKIEEARRLGLLEMSDEQKVEFLKGFLSRLRARLAAQCDLVNDVAYYSKQWYMARCNNGFEFPVSVQGNDLLALSMHWAQSFGGLDPSLAVWFMQGQQYPKPN